MSFQYYAGTIRKLTRGLPRSVEFDNIIAALKKKYPHLDVRYHLEMVYKINGNHNVHIHIMIKTPKAMHRKMILSVLPPGFNVWLESVKSQAAWDAYITKENESDVRAQLDFYHEECSEELIDEYPDDDENPSQIIV